MILPLIIFLVFVFVWYFPVYRKQGNMDRLPKKTVPIAIGVGLIPVFIATILVQFGLGYLLKFLGLTGIPYFAFDAFIIAALVEEMVKFLGAFLIVRKVKPKREVDYALIFGAVGLGFEVLETIICLDNVLVGAERGVFALHIIWQLWMGLYFYRYHQAKQMNDKAAAKKNLTLALLVPIVIHGMHDFLAFVTADKVEKLDINNLANAASAETAVTIWLVVLCTFLIFEIVFQIITYRKALKAARESKLTDQECQAE